MTDFRRSAAAFLACIVGACVSVQGQTAVAAGPDLSAEPIACWWKADKDAVIVGEQFKVTLTCSVLESGEVRAVPDPKQFDVAALQVAPFEVVAATAHPELQFPPRRYFQHEYTVRLLKEGLFGQDVAIPSVRIAYATESAATGEAVGPPRSLVLPALPVRVLSTVPRAARGIRDTSADSFGSPQRLLSLSRGAFMGAGIFFAFALVFVGLAVRKVAGEYRQRTGPVERRLSTAAVMGGCLREIRRIEADARNGWTDALASRALAVLRIAAAVAIHRTVSQFAAGRNAEPQTGQVVMRRGFLGRKRALVSAPTTPAAITRALATPAAADPAVRSTLEQIDQAMRVFTAALYSSGGVLDPTSLAGALESGASAMRRLPSRVQPFVRVPFWSRATESGQGASLR